MNGDSFTTPVRGNLQTPSPVNGEASRKSKAKKEETEAINKVLYAAIHRNEQLLKDFSHLFTRNDQRAKGGSESSIDSSVSSFEMAMKLNAEVVFIHTYFGGRGG